MVFNAARKQNHSFNIHVLSIKDTHVPFSVFVALSHSISNSFCSFDALNREAEDITGVLEGGCSSAPQYTREN